MPGLKCQVFQPIQEKVIISGVHDDVQVASSLGFGTKLQTFFVSAIFFKAVTWYLEILYTVHVNVFMTV